MSELEQAVPGTTVPPLDKLVAVFVRIRDAKAKMEAEHKQKVDALDEQMKAIKSALLDYLKEVKLESARTTAGTFYRTTKTRYWTNDWASMGQFIIEHNVPSLYENRLHQGNIKKFLDENPELVPPGLNVDSEYTITVKKEKGE
jgi:hypothetical protein